MNANKRRRFGVEPPAGEHDELFVRRERTVTDQPKFAEFGREFCFGDMLYGRMCLALELSRFIC